MVEPEKNRTELLRAVKEGVVGFDISPLAQERIRNGVFPVIGEGSHTAKIMFVGEAPGKNEAATGRPFAGAAGRGLNELLASVGIPREDVYITNVVKDRPPQNRDPNPEEIALYAPFLDRQIDIIQPRVIALLGRHSMKYIMEKFELEDQIGPISRLHGKVFEARASYGDIQIIPFFHPAAALYNPPLKKDMIDDFQALRKFA